MIPYGSIHANGQWWDGKTWRKDSVNRFGGPDGHDELMMVEKLSGHEANNCHVDGAFECPRCRRSHFIVDNFDLLCDGCETLVYGHPEATAQMREGIDQWRHKKRKHWGGSPDADITARIALRAAG